MQANQSAAGLVSVVMPVFNAEPFLAEAVQSVLAQRYANFELLAIDDGSTDRSGEILEAFARQDRRVLATRRENRGVVAALNCGLAQARGSYLARLDADDRMHPERLARQVGALSAHPSLVIVGSAYRLLSPDGRLGPLTGMPLGDTAIRWHALFHSPFASSSVLLRLEILRREGLGFEPPDFAEDYRLWSKVLEFGGGLNLPEALLDYRLHPQQASRAYADQVRTAAAQVSQANLRRLGLEIGPERLDRLRDWFYRFPARLSRAEEGDALALVEILERFSARPGMHAAGIHAAGINAAGIHAAEVRRIRGRWALKLLSVRSEGGLAWKRRLVARLGLKGLIAAPVYAAGRLPRGGR